MKLQIYPRHRIQCRGTGSKGRNHSEPLTELFLLGTHHDLIDFTNFKGIGFIQPSFWKYKNLSPEKWRPDYSHFKGSNFKSFEAGFFLIGIYFFFQNELAVIVECWIWKRFWDLLGIYIHVSQFTDKEIAIRLSSWVKSWFLEKLEPCHLILSYSLVSWELQTQDYSQM